MSATEQSIKSHGAKAVYDAACARLSGNRAPLARVGLEAATIGDANRIMAVAFAAMAPAARAEDLANITIQRAQGR